MPQSPGQSAHPETPKPPERYAALSRWLHWLVAGAIVLQYLLGERAEEAAAADKALLQLASLAQHKSIGITVLALVLLRIVWRRIQPAPRLPAAYTSEHPRLAQLATWMHIALYGLLLFLPLSGWLLSSASAYSVSWFGVVQLPDLVGPDTETKDWLTSAHHLAAKVLFVLALLHIAAALKHLFVDKNQLTGRMADSIGVALFGATVLVGIWFTWPSSTKAPAGSAAPPAVVAAEPDVTNAAAAQTTLPAWTIDYDRSDITFSAQQAGAEFTGVWQTFTADIRFDADQLSASRAEVRIDASSVATQDSERDTTLGGADWFDWGQFPEVIFRANSFTPTDSGFSTAATLEIRGVSYPVNFSFSVADTGAQVELSGRAALDRLALGLGVTEWADTKWVGQYVSVAVKVYGTR